MTADTLPITQQITVRIDGTEDRQVKLRGILNEVNLSDKTCRVYTSDSEYVTCHFHAALETDVVYALGRNVEVSGEWLKIERNGHTAKVDEIRLQSVEQVYDSEPASNSEKHGTVKDLLESGIVGMWADREDLHTTRDVINYARRLRGKLPLPDDADVALASEDVDPVEGGGKEAVSNQ